MQINTVTEVIIAIFIQKGLENNFRDDCEMKTAKRRYYTLNIFSISSWASHFICIYHKVQLCVKIVRGFHVSTTDWLWSS